MRNYLVPNIGFFMKILFFLWRKGINYQGNPKLSYGKEVILGEVFYWDKTIPSIYMR
jgi:hypothetical protein